MVVGTSVGLHRRRQARVAGNAVLFFEARKGLRSAAGVRDDALDIFCECGRDECLGKVAVPFKVFFRARRHAGWFIVMAGHHADAIEEVVEAADAYWVVGKQRRW
jgi:hypothetical protein